LRLPNAVPYLLVGVRIASGIAVIGAITGELYAGSSRVGKGGLGYSILYASTQLQTDYLFALVLAATVLGFGFFFVVKVLEWYFLSSRSMVFTLACIPQRHSISGVRADSCHRCRKVPLQNLHHKKETEAQYRGGQHQCKQIVRLQLGGCVEDRVSESSLPTRLEPA